MGVLPSGKRGREGGPPCCGDRDIRWAWGQVVCVQAPRASRRVVPSPVARVCPKEGQEGER